MGKVQIWWNLKFHQRKFKLEVRLVQFPIGVSPSGNVNYPSGNSNYNLSWGNLKSYKTRFYSFTIGCPTGETLNFPQSIFQSSWVNSYHMFT